MLNRVTEVDPANDVSDSNMKHQHAILQATVCHQLCIKYPPPRSYIHSFLKRLITMVFRITTPVSSYS